MSRRRRSATGRTRRCRARWRSAPRTVRERCSPRRRGTHQTKLTSAGSGARTNAPAPTAAASAPPASGSRVCATVATSAVIGDPALRRSRPCRVSRTSGPALPNSARSGGRSTVAKPIGWPASSISPRVHATPTATVNAASSAAAMLRRQSSAGRRHDCDARRDEPRGLLERSCASLGGARPATRSSRVRRGAPPPRARSPRARRCRFLPARRRCERERRGAPVRRDDARRTEPRTRSRSLAAASSVSGILATRFPSARCRLAARPQRASCRPPLRQRRMPDAARSSSISPEDAAPSSQDADTIDCHRERQARPPRRGEAGPVDVDGDASA